MKLDASDVFALTMDKNCVGEDGIDINSLWYDNAQYANQHWDDMSGKVSDPALIQAARSEEIQ